MKTLSRDAVTEDRWRRDHALPAAAEGRRALDRALSASEISRVLADRIESLVITLAGGRPVRKEKGQLRLGSKGSLAVELRQPKAGIWCDHESGQGGDALDLVRHLTGGGMSEAIRWSRDWLGMPVP